MRQDVKRQTSLRGPSFGPKQSQTRRGDCFAKAARSDMAMQLVGQMIEIKPLAQTEPQLRQYTEAELAQFIEDHRIDAETSAVVRRLVAEDAL